MELSVIYYADSLAFRALEGAGSDKGDLCGNAEGILDLLCYAALKGGKSGDGVVKAVLGDLELNFEGVEVIELQGDDIEVDILRTLVNKIQEFSNVTLRLKSNDERLQECFHRYYNGTAQSSFMR